MERNYSIAMGLRLYSIEHFYDISYWGTLDGTCTALGSKIGMGISSGIRHTFGVGNIEIGLEFFALLLSSHQILNLKLCAG